MFQVFYFFSPTPQSLYSPFYQFIFCVMGIVVQQDQGFILVDKAHNQCLVSRIVSGVGNDFSKIRIFTQIPAKAIMA